MTTTASATRQPVELWGDLRQHVLRSTEWLTETDIVKRSAGAVDPLMLVQWRTFGFVFALDMGIGPEVYPAYVFDPANQYRPRPVIRPVHGRLFQVKESLGLAAWFASQNAHLENQRPLELVALAPDRVLTAARKVYRNHQDDWLSMEEENIYKAVVRT